MKNKNLYSLLTLAVVFVFFVSLFSTVNVLADDSTPPAPTEAPVVDMPPTDVPVPTEVPTQEPPIEQISVEQILSQVPDGTDVVILDENGNPLPMASQAAADAILSDADPMWCPEVAGVQILPGGAGCTSAFVRFTTASGLINTLQAGSYTGPGTIYISTGNIAVADRNKNIVLNGNTGNLVNLTDLTIQGGWDFGSNLVVNRSIFVNSTFEIKNWNGNITVNDLKFELLSGISGDGLTIKNIDGDVTLNNVVITDSQTDNGLFINNVDNIEINDSKFNDNNKNGADLSADGTIDLNNVIAKGNGGHGVDAYADGDLTIVDGTYQNNGKRGVRAQSNNGDIDVTGSEFINNDMSGIRAEAYNGNVTLTDVLSRNNDIHGANLFASETISINGGQFYNNDASGVHTLSGAGDLLVTSGVFTFNGDSGLYAEALSGDATISGDFSANWGDGLVVENGGDITITDVTATDNAYNGAFLNNTAGTGNISVTDSNFDSNTSTGYDMGLEINSSGTVTLGGVSTSNNLFGDGSDIGGFSNLSIENSFFSGNESSQPDWGYGLYISNGYGEVILMNVVADGNKSTPGVDVTAGAYIDTVGAVNVTGGSFSNNTTGCGCGADGLDIYNANSATLVNVTANGNTWDGVYTNNVFIVKVTGGYFNNNGAGFGSGLDLEAPGIVTLENVRANGNVDSGAYIGSESPMDISIICSQFSGNSEYGLEVEGDGQVALDQVTFINNGLGDYFVDTAVLSIFSTANCNPEESIQKGQVDIPSLPLNLVNVTSGQAVGLDCEHFGGTKLILENGNSTTLPCPIDDSASIIDNKKIEDLPKPLPESVTFKSAFTTSVTQKGEKLGKLINSSIISFVIPEGADVSKLAILFWDGSEWTEVKNTYVRNDPVTGESYLEAFVNETGTFVLVQK